MVGIIVAAVLFVAVPVVAVSAAHPRRRLPRKVNYRGREVSLGLGLVWLVWSVLAVVAYVAMAAVVQVQPEWYWAMGGSVPFIVGAVPLVAGACVLGYYDDACGDGSPRGFKGHLRALRHGKLDTGMAKMLGIGLLSIYSAIMLAYPPAVAAMVPLDAGIVARIVCGAATMALCANLVNLLDLRPLRASKGYVVLLVLALVAMACGMGDMRELSAVGWEELAAIALMCLGPMIATWRFDAREHGMLGDAGANAMGALVGYLFAASLPTWGLAVLAVALLVLNLLSEKVSFTKVIEGNRVLSALDRAFRPRSR